MLKQVNKLVGALLLAGLLVSPGLAQPTAHYVPGSEGLKAATLPPPGIWLRDYNSFYYSDRLNDNQGKEITAADPKAVVYANVPRLLWITDVKVLGGFLGVDALLPLVYTSLKANTPAGPFNDQTFGIGDVFFEGTWSWHLKQWDFALGAGAWAPTGDFDTIAPSVPNPTNPGRGFWTEMFTAGATWYPDANKKWSLSVLNRYEYNQQQEDTDKTIGQAYTVEGGIGYGITKTVDVGVVGYYQQQVTGTSGATDPQRGHNRVAAIGPEVGVFFPSSMLGLSLRYEYEFMAESRLQGHTATLTITKKF
jgi:hypothetical protein